NLNSTELSQWLRNHRIWLILTYLLGVCGTGVKPLPDVCRVTAAVLQPEYDAPLEGPGDCALLIPPWALGGPLAFCRTPDMELTGLRAFMGARR
ncbi:hypothetical protein M9458_029236, partial [Cirrhinus mrigala]